MISYNNAKDHYSLDLDQSNIESSLSTYTEIQIKKVILLIIKIQQKPARILNNNQDLVETFKGGLRVIQD